MDDDKLGQYLRNARLLTLRGCSENVVLDLSVTWDESSDASHIVDAENAKRVYALGYHDAMTEAVRMCNFQVARHTMAVEFQAAAKNYVAAGLHATKAESASRCALAITEILRSKGGT